MQRFMAPLLLLIVLAALGPQAPARSKVNPNPLKIIQAHLEATDVKPGSSSNLEIRWQLAPEYHAYADQFRIETMKPNGTRVTLQEISPLSDFDDKFSGKRRKAVHGEGRILAVIEWPKSLPDGEFRAEFNLTYQACADDHCLLPKKLALDVTAKNQAATSLGALSHLDSLGWKIWFIVFFAGVLTSFTPCIFPLIPITIAVLSSGSGRKSRRHGFILSLFYVFGIAMTYALLGLVAASTGALFGQFLGHPAVITGLAVFFVALGLSMLGWFTIGTPHFIAKYFHAHRTKGGFIGAFFAGALAGIVASPCVGPVLAAILSYVAQTQDLLFGFGLLFVFALGLGQLFLLIGTFSDVKKLLPKSGAWMNFVKYFFALTFFALALFYIRPWLSEDWLWRLAGVFILIGLVNPEHWRGHATLKFTRGKVIWLSLLIALAGALIVGGSPQKWLRGSEVADETKALPWIPYSENVLQQAATESKPVVIDFYADWCVACKELEKFTFSTPEVQAYANRIVWVKFDATSPSPVFEELQKKYGIVGLPHLVFIDGKGKWREDLTLTGFEKAPEFVKRLTPLFP